MTRPEITGVRNLAFSGWMRRKLRDSKLGLSIHDLDGILDDYERKLVMLIEAKSHWGKVSFSQRSTHALVDKALRLASQALGYQYWGYHVIRLSGNDPEDSEVITVDGRRVTAKQLIDFLNMDKPLAIAAERNAQ